MARLDPHGNCTTCGRPPDNPYRKYGPDGEVRFGCVDAAHDSWAMSSRDAWHNRPEAKGIRATSPRRSYR